ncbi:hypothetical protein, unknown function [Leishmania tarentolae]|uniref:Uncharacterized protein n=1 Tax=Leishmania tarentolae TaxID=5689 RepID=A0A640K9P7_LEITA|nr:hypothetical protein, unknown function [Leishmania tarentolae]
MLRASYLLRPTRCDGTDDVTVDTPAEYLSDVYLCVSSPPVIEEWVGWPEVPYVVDGSARCLIDPRGALLPCTPVESSAPCVGDTKAPCMEEAKPTPQSLPELLNVAPLDRLCRAYAASDERRGSAFLQVYSVGVHGLLSPEAKSMLTACTMAVLRSRLSYLLGALLKQSWSEADSTLDMGAVAVLKRYCSASAALPTPLPSAIRPACCLDKDGGGMHGRGWVITWSLELVFCVAGSIIAARSSPTTAYRPLYVSDCEEVIRLSLHFGLGVALQRDAEAYSSKGTAESHTTPTLAAERHLRYDAMCVQLTECALASSHPLDVRHAVDLTRAIYTDYVRAAQAHAEDGTEAFQRLALCAGQANDPLQLATARDAWGEALQSYQLSAISAQGGVLFVLQHDLSAQSGPAALLPLTAREEQSRSHAAEKSNHVVFPPTLRDHVLGSVRVRRATAYFNHVLVCQAWSSEDVLAEAHARHWEGKLLSDDALAPARAAMQWRASLLVSTAKGGAAVTSDACGGQTLVPTPLQWVFYTVRRQLVVAVANRSQTALTGRRLGLNCAASAAVRKVSQLSPSALRALAEQCVKALPMARGLLGWHCPWPVPLCLQSTDSRAAIPSAAAVEEVLWTLRILCKLRWRAAQLYEAVGDSSEKNRQMRALRDDVQRWSSRRRARVLAADGATSTSGGAAWTPIVEDVVCHIDDADWSALTKELSGMLLPA